MTRRVPEEHAGMMFALVSDIISLRAKRQSSNSSFAVRLNKRSATRCGASTEPQP